MSKRGPEPKYQPWMCDKVLEIAQEGKHVAEMLIAIGVRSKDTFYRWLKEYPEFGEAYEESKLISQAVHERILLQGALGQIPNFNFSAFAMIMNNKFPDEYKRGTGQGNNTEIVINNNTMNLTRDEIDLKIAQKLEQLKLLGVEIDKPNT